MRFAVKFFLSYELLKSRKRRIFCQRATYKGKYGKAKEAIESAKAGLLPQKGDVRKSRKRKEKKKTKEGKKVAPAKARFRVPYTKNSFFCSQVFGLRSGPSRLKYRLLRDLVYEEAMCKGSSGHGLLYAAKAVT